MAHGAVGTVECAGGTECEDGGPAREMLAGMGMGGGKGMREGGADGGGLYG